MARRLGMPRTWAVAAINFIGTGARWLASAPAARRRPDELGNQHDALGRWVMTHARALRSRARIEDYS
jgi:hypothetical protein